MYFSELKYTYTESTASYSVLALMCDLGGALGLILGSTVLTFFEIGDLIVTLVFTGIERRLQQKTTETRRRATVNPVVAIHDVL
jgi:Amiloride-sensitive sodium channel